jgi:hypothetical protein
MKTIRQQARQALDPDHGSRRERDRSRGAWQVAGAALLCATVSAGLHAQQQQPPPAAAQAKEDRSSLGFNVGATWSDNLGRTPDGVAPLEDGWIDFGILANLARSSPRFEGALDANVAYRTFTDDVFDDQIVGGVNATGRVQIVPEYLSWVVEDNFGQGSIDAFAVESPQNSQNVNYFTTGPDLTFGLTDRSRLVIQGRYGNTSYEDSLTDNDRLSGSIALERRIARPTTMRLRLGHERVEFDQSPPNSSYDVQEAVIGVRAVGVKTVIDGEVGYSVLRDNGESDDGIVARLVLTRDTTARSKLNVTLGTEFSDSGGIFRVGQVATGPGTSNPAAIVSGDPLRADYVFATWALRGTRLSWQFSADFRDESHEQETTLDVTRKTFGVEADYRLSSRIGLRASASHGKDDFKIANTEVDDTGYGAGLTWRLGPRLVLGGSYEHSEGSSGHSSLEFTENRYTLTLNFARDR